jgi:MFS family permease
LSYLVRDRCLRDRRANLHAVEQGRLLLRPRRAGGIVGRMRDAPERPPAGATARWHDAWPGLCATLIGNGLGRFAYTALIPFLVASGTASDAGAAYLGAANLAGYLVGSLLAAPLGRLVPVPTLLRWALALSVLSFALSVLPFGAWWLLPWRILVGVTGAVLMVLAPSLIIATLPPAERGRAGGLVYTGVGAGAMLGGLVVPPLAGTDPALAWAALAALAAVGAALSWRRWDRFAARRADAAAAVAGSAGALPAAALLLIAAYATDGAGFVPHTIFWVNYIVRDLGLGGAWGAANWLAFGAGALVGPLLAGHLGDRVGLAPSLAAAFALKAAAVVLPTLAAAPAALLLSSVVVGALTPGISALVAARLAELAPAGGEARAWGWATLAFSAAQAASGSLMSAALDRFGSYPALYRAGALLEAAGLLLCLAAGRRRRARI